jgi:hypothetical protein
LNSKEEFIELMKLKAVKNEILDSPKVKKAKNQNY